MELRFMPSRTDREYLLLWVTVFCHHALDRLEKWLLTTGLELTVWRGNR